MSQPPPQCTSMCCQCTATVASRAKALSCCGGTCSTCAVFQASAELCWFVRTSWCPSTSRPASSRKGHQPSLYPTCNSKRWNIRSAGRRMHDETAAASQSTTYPTCYSTYSPLIWTQGWKDSKDGWTVCTSRLALSSSITSPTEQGVRTEGADSGFTSPCKINESVTLQLIIWLIRQIIFLLLQVASWL